MEGSFGTQKEHYGLTRIKVRTRQTEILYHTKYSSSDTCKIIRSIRYPDHLFNNKRIFSIFED